jgi:hypothetical protein
MPDFGKMAASFKKGFGKAKGVAKNLGTKIKKGAAAITKPTKALIGEAGPEIVVPMQKLGDAINSIYKQGSKTMLEATSGFLNSLPSNPSKAKIAASINKIKNMFNLGALKIKGGKFGLSAPIAWWNKGRNDRIEDENNASWKDLMEDDLAQRGQSDESFEAGEKPPLLGRPDQAFNPFRPAAKGGPSSGPTPAVRQAFERPVRGMMNLGKRAAGAVGGAVNKFKQSRGGGKKPLPVPTDTGRDMFGQKIVLNPSAESGWKKAVRAAASDGVDLPSAVTSAFRSAEEQQSLVNNADDPSVITPAPVGMSPHQQGWSLDIDQGSAANEWMRKNGKQYGFEWEGPTDPVHFDFKTNEDRGKFLQGDKSDWKEEKKKEGAKTLGGKMLSVVGSFLKGKVGDPTNLEAPNTTNPPEPSPSQTMISEQPVQQSTKNGNGAVIPYPVVVPSPVRIIPGPPQIQKLDPEVQRHYIVDQFSKGTRVEVAYV